MTYTTTWPSPLGPIVLCSDGEALTGLWFADQARHPLLPDAAAADCPAFGPARQWLERYFSGHDPGSPPPARPAGTEFQRAVWAILADIPYGTVRTYGGIAAQLARDRGIPRMSAQAVGGAVGRNPIAILLPCHRVVGSSGALVGYAGGLARKRALLALENALPPAVRG